MAQTLAGVPGPQDDHHNTVESGQRRSVRFDDAVGKHGEPVGQDRLDLFDGVLFPLWIGEQEKREALTWPDEQLLTPAHPLHEPLPSGWRMDYPVTMPAGWTPELQLMNPFTTALAATGWPAFRPTERNARRRRLSAAIAASSDILAERGRAC